jgi:hypothetical protein
MDGGGKRHSCAPWQIVLFLFFNSRSVQLSSTCVVCTDGWLSTTARWTSVELCHYKMSRFEEKTTTICLFWNIKLQFNVYLNHTIFYVFTDSGTTEANDSIFILPQIPLSSQFLLTIQGRKNIIICLFRTLNYNSMPSIMPFSVFLVSLGPPRND